MKNLIIIGTSTTAISIYDIVNTYKLFNIIGFAVDKEYKKSEFFIISQFILLTKLKIKKIMVKNLKYLLLYNGID